MHDLVLRDGVLIDGSGGEPRVADVAIAGDRIVHVGANVGRGAEEINAKGLIVTPGFIDLHTHYDAQATWDPILAPSSWHGVTSVVMGNCGVGFAPARPDAREWLIEMMEDVEEIPAAVMRAGLPWTWESFPDYLDALDALPHTVDLGAQVPHIALRAYVMGERAARDEAATEADIATMGGLLEQALNAGALGYACSRTDAHRLKDGSLVPGSMGDPDELLALATALGRAGHGSIQYLGNLSDWAGNYPFMVDLARRSGAAVQFLMSNTGWQEKLAGIDAAAAAGLRLIGHAPPRAVGNVLQWRAGRHPFMDRPSMKAIAGLPWPDQLDQLRDPMFRVRVLAEDNGPGEALLPAFTRIIYRGCERMYEVAAYPDYEPDPATDSIAARGRGQGESYRLKDKRRAGIFAEPTPPGLSRRRGGARPTQARKWVSFQSALTGSMFRAPARTNVAINMGLTGRGLGPICTRIRSRWCTVKEGLEEPI